MVETGDILKEMQLLPIEKLDYILIGPNTQGSFSSISYNGGWEWSGRGGGVGFCAFLVALPPMKPFRKGVRRFPVIILV